MDLYSAEPLVQAELASVDLQNGNHLASRPFVTMDEELVAAILDLLGIAWQHEVRRFIRRDNRGEVVEEATGDFELMLPCPIILEVKSGRIGSRYQRRLATQAGYGFAYVRGLLRCGPDARIQKVLSAIEEAKESWRSANHRARSGGAKLVKTETFVAYRLKRNAARAG